MSLSGIFLILFLLVHLSGNLQLLMDDEGRQFNLYAQFMTTNPIIKFVSIGLYLTIVLHAILGIVIWRQNRSARGVRYEVTTTDNNSFASRNMAQLGIIIFLFLIIHLWQFWFQMKFGFLEPANYDGVEVKNLYLPVEAAFSNIWFVLFYVFSMIVIAFHLLHGFQSAFQSLGLSHKRFMPLIRGFGVLYSILVPLGFAIIPIYFYFFK